MPAGLVIFDCDGVLVDSEPLANRVLAEELERIGLPLGYAAVCEQFVGLSLARCVEIVEERLGRAVPPGFLERLQRRTFEVFREGLEPVRGVARALERVRVPVCVASSGELDKMRFTLGLTGLLPRFEGRMFSAAQVARGKPWPDLFLLAARTLDTPPERCVVVEDSVPGVRAGVTAGMRVLGYAERSDASALREAGAVTFDAMERLPALLEHSG